MGANWPAPKPPTATTTCTIFARYWDDGDFIPHARRGGSAAYAAPYNGQDTHFHWATKGSHYVKSGAKYFFPARVQAVEGGF